MKFLFPLIAFLVIALSSYSQSLKPYSIGNVNPEGVESFSWSPVSEPGANFAALCFAVSGNNIYAGGDFTTIDGIVVNRIAKWNGSSWSALGSGMNNSVKAVAVDSYGNVYAGGDFTTAGGVSANRIAKWDGSSWSPLVYNSINGVGNTVYALAVINDNLYMGGIFSGVGGTTISAITRWDGSSWYAVGSGLNNTVYCLTAYGTDLYAGGRFTAAGSLEAYRIAKWNGSSWSALGVGLDSYVYSIAVSGTNVYAGGSFAQAINPAKSPDAWINAFRIAKFDGTAWSPMIFNGNNGVNNTVYAVAASGSDVYVGGIFTTAGGVTSNYIAKWNGSSWINLGGTNSTVSVLTIHPAIGSMLVGGSFTTVNGSITANRMAKFTDSENPLPVALLSFTSSVSFNKVSLSWSTASEENNLGFDVERKSSQTPWSKVCFVKGNGTVNNVKHYSCSDANLQPDRYEYRLKQIDYNGNAFYHYLQNKINIENPSDFLLGQNYPNPFNPETNIDFTLPFDSRLSLIIYDITGRVVSAPLLNQFKKAGYYSVKFNAASIPSGVYFYELSSGTYKQIKKLIVLK